MKGLAEMAGGEEIRSLITKVALEEDMKSTDQTVALPVGTASLLLADVEASTRMIQTSEGQAAAEFATYDKIVSEAIGANRGVRPKDQGEGDSFIAAFSRPSDAVAAALEIQRRLVAEDSPIKPRMAIHTGEVQLRDQSNYIGLALNRAARIRAVANGGQILVSEVTAGMVADHLKDASLTDLGSHRLKDLSRPERLFQLVHADLPSEFPPLKSLDLLPNNLPVQRTTFIGRLKEMTEIKRLLDSTRLLTLSGAGGAGKTRLALHVAADLLESFADGVWFANLAFTEADDQVPGQIAEAIGLSEAQRQLLTTFIGSKSMLLILDNAEHVIAGASEWAGKLLDHCPGLKILVTSREPMNIDGEATYRVPSLTLPDEAVTTRLEALDQSEALQLFMDRAVRSRSNFKMTEENAADVAGICRRVDGIPLAIELAAARIRVLSPAQILEGLSDRFRLLTGSSRTAMPRQQTLRASVDWSYELLDANERKVLNRLSVFAASFDLDAAEVVASSDDLDRLLVLDVLTQLVDKSLVVAFDDGSATRYSMLETLRQYGLERLAESGEEESVRLRHREHFGHVAETVWDGLVRRMEWVKGFNSDMWVEVEAALEWTIAREDWELAARLFGAGLWGAETVGRDWLAKYPERLLPELPQGSMARLRVLANVGALAWTHPELIPYAQEAVEITRGAEDPEVQRYLPSALFGVGTGAMVIGDRGEAKKVLQELVESARALGQLYWELWGLAVDAKVRVLDGEVDEGLSTVRRLMERARELGSYLTGYLGFQAGLIHLQANRQEEALSYYLEAIPLMRQQKVRNVTLQWALDHASQTLIAMDRADEARTYVEEGVLFSRDYDLKSGNYWYLIQSLALLKTEDGQIDEAMALQSEAVEATPASRGAAHLNALTRLAGIELRHHDPAEGSRLLDEALRFAREYEPQRPSTGSDPFREVHGPLQLLAETSWEANAARSTRLLGFVDEWLRLNKVSRLAGGQRRRGEVMEKLVDALGAKRVEAELAAGKELGADVAIAYALGESSDPIASALITEDALEARLRTEGVVSDVDITSGRSDLPEAFVVPRAIHHLALAARARTRDPREAEQMLHEALAVFVEIEDDLLAAACLELIGQIAAAHESFEEAARLCGAALGLRERPGLASMSCESKEVVKAIGAQRFEALLEEGRGLSLSEAADYAARGRGERKRPSMGWQSLTPTEQKVAQLVAEGLSNPKIAERLFVSRRTIQSHLYNIFSKVGVQSRSELAAEFVRQQTEANT